MRLHAIIRQAIDIDEVQIWVEDRSAPDLLPSGSRDSLDVLPAPYDMNFVSFKLEEPEVQLGSLRYTMGRQPLNGNRVSRASS